MAGGGDLKKKVGIRLSSDGRVVARFFFTGVPDMKVAGLDSWPWDGYDRLLLFPFLSNALNDPICGLRTGCVFTHFISLSRIDTPRSPEVVFLSIQRTLSLLRGVSVHPLIRSCGALLKLRSGIIICWDRPVVGDLTKYLYRCCPAKDIKEAE